MGEIALLPNCPVCACSFDDTTEVKLCPACETPHHHDCWEYNEGCAIYGCTSIAGSKHGALLRSDHTQTSASPCSETPLQQETQQGSALTISPDRFVFQLMSEKSLLINIIRGIRVLAPALVIISGITYWQSASFFVFLLSIFVTALSSFFLAFAQSLFSTQIHFRPSSGLILRETFLGPFHLKTDKVNMEEARHFHIGSALIQQGLEHREMLRLVIEYKTDNREILYLDLAQENISPDNIGAWALLLRKETRVSILKAPPPKAGLLQKRITAFDLNLSKAENPIGELQCYWERRWLIAIPYLLFIPILGRAASFSFSPFFIIIPAIVLTALYSFFRPEELYNSIKGAITGRVSYISPEPDPLMFCNEEENIAKLSNFMTRVEESSFFSLISKDDRNALSWIIKIITLGPLPLLVVTVLILYIGKFFEVKNWFFPGSLSLLAVLLPPCMILFAMVGGAINRAIWNEDWAKGWLSTSRTALERLDEHKESEQQKLLRKKDLEELTQQATKLPTVPVTSMIPERPAKPEISHKIKES